MTDLEELERLARAARDAGGSHKVFGPAYEALGARYEAILSLIEDHKALREAMEVIANNADAAKHWSLFRVQIAAFARQALGDKPESEEYSADQRMSDQQDAYRKWAGDSHE